jgi:hypothetical protein
MYPATASPVATSTRIGATTKAIGVKLGQYLVIVNKIPVHIKRMTTIVFFFIDLYFIDCSLFDEYQDKVREKIN